MVMSQLLQKLFRYRGAWLLSAALAFGASTVFAMPVCADVPSNDAKATEQGANRLTQRQLESLVLTSKTGASSKVTGLTGTGPKVWITAQREPEATEKNMKIDAVMLAKAIVSSAGSQVEAVEVVFSEEGGKNGRVVTVSKGQIDGFGNGQLTVDQLLAALQVEYVRPKKQIELEPGPELARRLLLKQRLEKLREQGTGIKPFETIFQEIESLVKAGDEEKMNTQLSFLESRVDGQEEQLKQAKLKARGLGGVPAAPGAAAGGQTRTTAGVATAGAELPSDYQRVMGIFQKDHANILRQIESKDRTAGARLRTVVSQATTLLSQNKVKEAFRFIGEFHQSALAALGYDPFAPSGAPSGGGYGGGNSGGGGGYGGGGGGYGGGQGGPPGGPGGFGPPGGGPPGGPPPFGGPPGGGGGFGPPP